MVIPVIIGVVLILVGLALGLNVGGLASRTTTSAEQLEADQRDRGKRAAAVPGNLGRQIGWGLAGAGVVVLVVGFVT